VNTSRKRLRRDADIRSAAAARRRPETSLFVESHLPSKVALSSMSSHEICLPPRRDSVRRRSRLDVLNSLWDFSTMFRWHRDLLFLFRLHFFDDASEFSVCFFLRCFYYLLKVHVNFYISTFVLSKLYSTFVHTTFSLSEIYNILTWSACRSDTDRFLAPRPTWLSSRRGNIICMRVLGRTRARFTGVAPRHNSVALPRVAFFLRRRGPRKDRHWQPIRRRSSSTSWSHLVRDRAVAFRRRWGAQCSTHERLVYH